VPQVLKVPEQQTRIRADPGARARLAGLLVTDPVSGRSGVDRLKAPAKAATLGRFKARLAYWGWLDGLGPTEQWLTGVSAQKIAHFAGQARTTDVGDLRDADGHPVDPDDLATIAPCITHTIRRFGDWVLDLSPPEAAPVTALNLAPGALFPGRQV
jgi:hypothetical protein